MANQAREIGNHFGLTYMQVWSDTSIASQVIDKMKEQQATIAQQTKARKQAQADLETYKGRCTDLEHQNERLEAENARLTRCLKKANEQTEHFEREYYLRGDVIAQLTEQLAAAQKVIDAAGNLIAQKCRHNTEIAYKRLAKAIAEQKEGK